MDLPEALQQAITHHKAGELKDAERLYRFIFNEHALHDRWAVLNEFNDYPHMLKSLVIQEY